MTEQTFKSLWFADHYGELRESSTWFQHLYPDPWHLVKLSVPELIHWHQVTITVANTVNAHTGNPHDGFEPPRTQLITVLNHCVQLYGEPGWCWNHWQQPRDCMWLMGINMQSWLWKQDYVYTLWRDPATAVQVQLTHRG